MNVGTEPLRPDSPEESLSESVERQASSQQPSPGGAATAGRVMADDMLPPVEPPSAGFLVQLFLVPGVIVAIIVGVYLTFYWLAHLGNDPQAYLRALRRDSEGRWQAALNFANDLRGPGGAALKQDATLATEVGSVLDDEVAKGRTSEQSQQLKFFLCKALGEFAVPEAAAPLVARAADLSDLETAQAAVEALGQLSSNLKNAKKTVANPERIEEVILEASRQTDAKIRYAAAYTLGVFGGDKAVERLLAMKDDASDTVRFNVATALARNGRDEAYEGLAEMLALDDIDAGPDEQSQSDRYNRALVVVNALRAVVMLVDDSGQTPPGSVLSRIEELCEDPVSNVRASASAVVEKVRRLSAP